MQPRFILAPVLTWSPQLALLLLPASGDDADTIATSGAMTSTTRIGSGGGNDSLVLKGAATAATVISGDGNDTVYFELQLPALLSLVVQAMTPSWL